MNQHPSDQDFDLWSMQTILKHPPEAIDIQTAEQLSPKLASVFHGMREFLERTAIMRVHFPEQANDIIVDSVFDGNTFEASVDMKGWSTPTAWIIRLDIALDRMVARGVLAVEVPSDCPSCGYVFHTLKDLGSVDSRLSSDFLVEFYKLVLFVVRDFQAYLNGVSLPEIESSVDESKFYPRLQREFLGLF